jgi:hypothetical protein
MWLFLFENIHYFIYRSVDLSVDQWAGFFVSIETRNPSRTVSSEKFNIFWYIPLLGRVVSAMYFDIFWFSTARRPWAIRLTTALS